MSYIVPNYYASFHCIAQNCKHTCCKGWEIDIDAESYQKYQNLKGALHERMQKCIATDGGPHFVLDKQERCPFLNDENLCDLILQKGEDFLCQICKDHPRFRNFLGNRTEIGLGLCCEEAVRLILTKTDKTEWIALNSDEEHLSAFQKSLLLYRKQAIDIAQNRHLSIEERLLQIQKAFEIEMPSYTPEEKIDFLKHLERMDQAWDTELSKIKNIKLDADLLTPFAVPFEQLLVYFLYRHVLSALDETELKAYLAFCMFSVETIQEIFFAYCKAGQGTILKLQEIVRLYSSEIEYSEENIDTILNTLYVYQI